MARKYSCLVDGALEEISALEYILLGDLLDLLEEADGDAEAWKWISKVLDTLLKAMPREFEQDSQPLQQMKQLASELRDELRDWITSYIAHQRHERRILQDAFNNDIGAAD